MAEESSKTPSPSEDKKYDLVIFGASGFTGQFVVEEVARTIEEEKSIKWAIAGRNMQKLQKVLEVASKETGKELEETPIVIADLKAEQSLNDMAKDAKIVINCVGPYRFFGSQVVRACIENGAHHVDISGEPQFLEGMQLLYHTIAQEKGVYVVGSCGFDSIPADMGVLYTKQQFEGDLNHVEGYVGFKAGPDGGHGHYATWQSAIHGFACVKETIAQRKKLYSTPLPKPKHKMPRRGNFFFAQDVNSYCLPFPGSDRSVVNRTQRFIFDQEKKRPVQFNAYIRFPSLLTAMMTTFVGVVFGLMASFGIGRTLLEKFPKLFSLGLFTHEGPTRKQIGGSSFNYTFVGKGYPTNVENIEEEHADEPDKKIVTRVVGPEPGYVATPICVVQTAYVMLAEKDKLPQGGGVFTPGGALEKTTIIDRLDKHNVKFITLEK